jgi:hypothetical protein
MEDWRTEASSSGRKKGPSGRIWWRLAAAVVEGWEPVVLEEGCLAKAGTGAGGGLRKGSSARQQGKRTAEAAVRQPMLQKALSTL